MNNKISDLTKRLTAKQELREKAVEARDKQAQKVQELERDIKLLEAEIVTAHLVANNMSLEDLSELLSTTSKEVGHVSSD